MSDKRPFHFTIVDAIRRCPIFATNEMIHIFRLIMETKIPDNHDQIIGAIDEYFHFHGAEKFAREIRLVKESLLEQKRASTKSHEEESGISLDELQGEVEKLLALLKDRQTGNRVWNTFMSERLQNLHKLTSRVLEK